MENDGARSPIFNRLDLSPLQAEASRVKKHTRANHIANRRAFGLLKVLIVEMYIAAVLLIQYKNLITPTHFYKHPLGLSPHLSKSGTL
jgi:hypothetical protein